jgi:hypothetical protein
MRLGAFLALLVQFVLFIGLVTLIVLQTRALFSPKSAAEAVVISDYDWDPATLANWSAAKHDWRNRRYVFVGGIQVSGSSLMEKVLSSQLYSAGLRVEATELQDRRACRRPDPANPTRCRAPQDEGSFVTRAYQLYLNSEVGMASADFSFDCREENPTKSWGNCARGYHITAAHIRHWQKETITRLGDHAWSASGQQGVPAPDISDRSRYLPRHGNKILRPPADFRSLLLHDWAPFWGADVGNQAAPFLVEKDIPNSVRALLLQELFGRDRTAFVFMLRHPFASCRNFKCPATLTDQLGGWLLLYETLMQDLPHIAHYVLVHYEGLVIQPAAVLGAVRDTLGWRELPLEYQFHGRAVYLPPASGRVYNSSRLYNVKERTAVAASGAAGVGFVDSESGLAQEQMLQGSGQGQQQQRARSLAGYKKYPVTRDAGVSVSGKLRRAPLVTIETSDEAVEWSFNYEHELKALRHTQPDVHRQLLAMEARLNKFCYSLRTLTPICTHEEPHQFTGEMVTRLTYVFRQSAEPLPSIDPTVPQQRGRISAEGAEAIRQRLAHILFEH